MSTESDAKQFPFSNENSKGGNNETVKRGGTVNKNINDLKGI